MNASRLASVAVVALAAVPTLALGPAVDGILATSNGDGPTYLAVQVELADDQALARIEWVNNDEIDRPEVYLTADAGGSPDLVGTRASLQTPAWASLDWVTGELANPVVSTSGSVFVVFEFADGNQMMGSGFGKGAGVAYRQAKARRLCLISQDGQSWTPIWDRLDVQLSADFVPDESALILGAGAHKSDSESQSGEDLSGRNNGYSTALREAWPNPFNPSTVLGFDLAERGPVDLAIYNLRGQRLRVLRQGNYPAGSYRVRWDGTDERGQRLASGVYLARLLARGEQHSQRLVLIK